MTKRAERGGNGRVANTRQANYLRECFNYPQIILQINQKLMQCQQATVVESDFSLPEDRELLRHLYQQMTGRNIVTTAELCDSLEDEILQDRVHSLLQLSPTPESELSRLPEKLALSVLRWRQDKINDCVKELQLLHQEINSDDGIELAKMYAQQINEASLIIYQINKAVANLLAT
jgi:hypothetical protein